MKWLCLLMICSIAFCLDVIIDDKAINKDQLNDYTITAAMASPDLINKLVFSKDEKVVTGKSAVIIKICKGANAKTTLLGMAFRVEDDTKKQTYRTMFGAVGVDPMIVFEKCDIDNGKRIVITMGDFK